MQQFLVDFQTFSGPLVFYAMQGDSLSRKFQLVITDGGTPWTPPSGAAWFVYFGAPGMSSGFYDTITPASGSPYPAISVAENVATVEIAAQALEIAGINQLSVVVNDSTGYQIASWSIALHIKALPGYTASAATVYYNVLSGQVAQVLENAQAAETAATLAQSWAVGGTGSREGENTNNSQYWAQQAQSIAGGQLGWYATEQALQAAHPTGQNGQWAIIGTTDTIWTWDSDTSAWVDTGATAALSNYYTIPQANAAFATAAQGAKADTAVQSVNGQTGTAITLTPAIIGAATAAQGALAVTAMQPAVYDPSGLGVNTTVQVYTHTRSGTVNNFQGAGAVGRALLTADIQAGDTFTVNGQAVTAYMGASLAAEIMAGSKYAGRWVSFVVDSEEATLNFDGGVGLDIYSTEETKTYKIWVDGRPIYRKVFVIQNPVSGTQYPTGLSGIEIVSLDIHALSATTNSVYQSPYYSPDTRLYIIPDFNNKSLYYESSFTATYFTAILEYVKETDL